MGAGGSVGFVGRAFGGMAARGGAALTAESVASVASRPGNQSGSIGGEIADRSLANFMPHLAGGRTTAPEPDRQIPNPVPNPGASAIPHDPPVQEAVPQNGIPNPQQPAKPVSRQTPGYTGPIPARGGDDTSQPVSRPIEGAHSSSHSHRPSGPGISTPAAQDLSGYQFANTEITGGHITTTAIAPDGREANVELFNTSQFERPDCPHTVVSAADGSQWYQIASGDAMGDFYPTPAFTGDASEAAQVAEAFPGIPEGTMLRQVEAGVLEASAPDGSGSLWYSSAFYQEPDAPHETIQGSDGLSWYAMTPHAETPQFEAGESAQAYNQSLFGQFIPSYDKPVVSFDSTRLSDGMLEVRHEDGSGTMFYDRTMYQPPRGDHKIMEDSRGGQWYAIPGTPAVERRPVFEAGRPVYEGDDLKTIQVETIRYKTTPARFSAPEKRPVTQRKAPRKKP